jgi:hypothetical protein
MSETIDLIMSSEGWFKIQDTRHNRETNSTKSQVYGGTWLAEHRTSTKVIVLLHQIREQDLHSYNDGENAAVTRKAEFTLDENNFPIKAKIMEMFPAKEFTVVDHNNQEFFT